MEISIDQLMAAGLDQDSAQHLLMRIQAQSYNSAEQAWQDISQNKLNRHYPFNVHLLIFSTLFPNWRKQAESAPAWIPSANLISTNIYQFMTELQISDVKTLHHWSTQSYQDFWHAIVKKLHIVFKKPPTQTCNLSQGIESPQWFFNAELNIVDSCFTAPSSKAALIYQENKKIKTISYAELNHLSNQIANSLIDLGLTVGDAIAITMPMNQFAIAIYLGIIKMGGVVVSIADSFSSQEIAIRLKIANTKALFTQDVSLWIGKKLPLYEKIKAANPNKIIVIPEDPTQIDIDLRDQDLRWDEFLSNNRNFVSVPCSPMQRCNILFSSGTTAEPKAITWSHSTAIKTASDAYLHQNIQVEDILAWPSNLGWMMGPWLIFAALINQASIAIYPDAPKDRNFGEFIQNAKVTMLGVVPTLVASWRQSQCMENLDWSTIKVLTSTGECSNPEDMLYLMSLAGYKPIIEYCGGTEIGGSYVSSTVIENNYPSLFSTPAMGLNFVILDEESRTSDCGEVAIIPPSVGLSVELLNANHHQIYYENMPSGPHGQTLRRHGDEIMQLSNQYYCVLGRSDDAMNLGGIKISAVEIERAIAGLPEILETAAIAITPPHHGPSLLVIYASTQAKLNKEETMLAMQKQINSKLNPLFKIYDLIFTSDLPKTASNKIMRRTLRKMYQSEKTIRE